MGECSTQSGEIIHGCRIGYRLLGKLNEQGDNAVLVPTWFGGTSEDLLFLAHEKAIDPEKFLIIFVDSIGNGVSISPSNSTSQPGGEFPQFAIADMVVTQHRLLRETLKINRLHAVIGLSMGGMQAFEWGVRYPGFVDRIISATGSPRLASFDIVYWDTSSRLLSMARECECRDPLAVLTGIGWLLQVPDLIGEKLPRESAIGAIDSVAASNPFDALKTWDSQRQGEAIMRHNIARDYGDDLAKAAASIESRFLIIVAADDRVVTPGPALKFAPMIGAETVILDAKCGHGDPWCDAVTFNGAVKDFLEKE